MRIADDLMLTRPSFCRIMICQPNLVQNDWKEVDGLYFPKDTNHIQSILEKYLIQARQSTVDIVLLPELTVPLECIPCVQSWSLNSGSIIIAGSHYHKLKSGAYVSRCPIIINGQVFFTEKNTPAPVELSPIAGKGLLPGQILNFFKNSSAGNFAVLICSDYLDTNT